jgi:Tol biopolymer transport system component
MRAIEGRFAREKWAMLPCVSTKPLRWTGSSSSNRTGRDELHLMRRDPATGQWGAPEQLTTDGAFYPSWSPVRDEILYRSDPTESVRVYSFATGESRALVRDPDIQMTIAFAEWSADGQTVYYTTYDDDGIPGFWAVPAAGGPSRPVVRVDSPAQQFVRWNFAADETQFYFFIQQFESDVWTMELVPGGS